MAKLNQYRITRCHCVSDLSEVISHGNGPTTTPESTLDNDQTHCRAVTVPHLQS